MDNLVPLWKRLLDHLDGKFNIKPIGLSEDPVNDTRVIAASMIWFTGSDGGDGDAMLMRKIVSKMIADFEASAAPSDHRQAFIEIAQESLLFLDQQSPAQNLT
ncbi:MAG: hypothetical protein ACK4VI_02610 [Alphaproteobacteria bacterium]